MSDLAASWHSAFFQRALLEAVLIGALGGIVGAHVLVRRLPFFVVAMSHATFPGVVVASVLGISLFIGGIGFGLVVVALVAALGSIKALDETSSIGVVLAGSFAFGVLVLSARPGGSRDLSAFLVGSVLTVTRDDIVATAITGFAIVVVLGAFHKELVLGAFDPGGAAALGYPVVVLDLVCLVAVTVTIVAAVPAVGTLLAVSVLTVPALTARQWADRMVPAMAVGAAVGAASGALGLCLSAAWGIAAGGAIALTSAGLFLLSAAAKAVRDRRRGFDRVSG